MIIDNIENSELYYKLGERIETAFKYLKNTDFTKIDDGKYEIDGLNIYASVQSYDTQPEKERKWEAHRRYIDVQYIADGIEKIGYSNIKDMNVSEQYDSEKDVLFLEGSGDYFSIAKGSFAIFAPDDVHKPCVCVEKPSHVKKIVVKVLL